MTAFSISQDFRNCGNESGMCVGWVCLNNFRIEDESANSTGTRGAHGGVISDDFYHLVFPDATFERHRFPTILL